MSTITTNEFQRKWVESLRSGNFLQVRNALTDVVSVDESGRELPYYEWRDGYCCLGVGLVVDPETDIHSGRDDEEELPSREVMARWGLQWDQATHLAEMNDGKSEWRAGQSVVIQALDFPAIADYIEQLDMVPYEYDPEPD